MAHFYPRSLLLLVLFIVISECRDSPLTDSMSASQDEDIALPCFNSNTMDSKSCYRVKWTKYATDSSPKKDILLWPSKSQDERLKWEADGKGQMSLFLRKLQKSDEGIYRCEFCQGWDCTTFKNISLKVKDCKVLPALKVAPTTTIRLKCPVDITSGQEGPKNISWAILKGDKLQPVDPKRVEINGTSLVIQSASASDGAWYRCDYIYGQTQRCFEINVFVQDAEDEDVVEATKFPVVTTKTQQVLTKSGAVLANRNNESRGTFIAVVASVILGIAIMAALIGVFVCRRCKSQRVTQQTHRLSAGTLRSTDGYEIVNLTLPEGPSNPRVNSLYQQFQEENICTFQY